MAIKIDIPGIGEVSVDGAAEESTMQDILAAVSKSEKTKQSEEKKLVAEQKKLATAAKNATTELERLTEEAEAEVAQSGKTRVAAGKVVKGLGELWTTAKESSKEVGNALNGIALASTKQFAKIISSYDSMADRPVQAGAEMLQFVIDLMGKLSKTMVSVVSAIGQTIVGFIPFVGDGIASGIAAIEKLASERVIDTAIEVATLANEVLRDEFEKRIAALNQYGASFISIAGGLSDVASLAAGAALPIKQFADAVTAARPYMNQIGLAGGDAAKQLSRAMGGLASSVGRSGRVLRDELLAMGISFAEQGGLTAQYMAQLRSFGKDIKSIPAAQLAQGTAEYAKHLRVLSDLTGQDASNLMAQARAEAQRGALMDKLSANQARAFQDSFAIFSTLPEQQGAKLQSALAQLLAGGVVTDPVIAGNRIVMDMLAKTAEQVSKGNINMVNATQTNLANAAMAFRETGESATDFATLMNPNGTSAVAQGMSQFSNALRQYRYDPGVAKAALQQTEAMAQASGDYIAITEAMVSFQVQMEGITGSVLPMYTKAMLWATEQTFDVIQDGIKYLENAYKAGADVTKQASAFVTLVADLLNAPATPSGNASKAADEMLPGLGRITSMGPGLSDLIDLNPFAKGGIAEGPASGHPAMLHGIEAVVPLPDGKSIPVDVNLPMAPQETTTSTPTVVTAQIDPSAFKDLTTAMQRHGVMLTEMVGLMQKNNNLTSGILQHSM